MNQEMSALEKNGTWEIVERPGNKRPVECKWIYIMKYQPYGT